MNNHAKYLQQCLWTKQNVVTKLSKDTSVSVGIVVSTNAPESFSSSVKLLQIAYQFHGCITSEIVS